MFSLVEHPHPPQMPGEIPSLHKIMQRNLIQPGSGMLQIQLPRQSVIYRQQLLRQHHVMNTKSGSHRLREAAHVDDRTALQQSLQSGNRPPVVAEFAVIIIFNNIAVCSPGPVQ
ncbi:hypothetical protein D3C86_1943340 [compost metagenome]